MKMGRERRRGGGGGRGKIRQGQEVIQEKKERKEKEKRIREGVREEKRRLERREDMWGKGKRLGYGQGVERKKRSEGKWEVKKKRQVRVGG